MNARTVLVDGSMAQKWCHRPPSCRAPSSSSGCAQMQQLVRLQRAQWQPTPEKEEEKKAEKRRSHGTPHAPWTFRAPLAAELMADGEQLRRQQWTGGLSHPRRRGG